MTATISRPAIQPPAPSVTAPDALSTHPTRQCPIPTARTSDGPNSRSTKSHAGPIGGASGGPDSPAATQRPVPTRSAPQGTTTTGGQNRSDAHSTFAAGSNVPDPAATASSEPARNTLLDPALCLAADVLDDIEQVRTASENRLRQMTRTAEDKDGEVRGLGYDETHPDVAMLAAWVKALLCGKDPKGNGCCFEHDATKALNRKMRKHPLGVWAKGQLGIGEKQGSRLLAAIGDPYIRPEILNEDGSVKSKEGPRTVSALWAYCGLHVLPGGQILTDNHAPSAAGDQHRDTDHTTHEAHVVPVGVAAKRRKGQRANWSSKAKMRAYLVAEKCVQVKFDPGCKASRALAAAGEFMPLRHGEQDPQDRDGQRSADAHVPDAVPACACSPYRVIYDARRAHTAVTHPDWPDGHSHNDALRIASKAILRDLWRAARDWHLSNGAAA